ncbi:MAG: ribonuclease P protein component [Campylobacterales bacterium]|nr:ribonuclease P protein component [Campylobacterales bacterium]
MGRLRAYDSLKHSREFALGYNQGKKWHCDCAVIFYKASLKKNVGFTASKKVGNAVQRNFCKRRLRAVFLELQDSVVDGSYIFVAKAQIHTLSHDECVRSVRWALRKLGCLHP